MKLPDGCWYARDSILLLDELVMRLGERSSIDPEYLLKMLEQPGTPLRITPDQTIYLRLRRDEDSLAEAFGLIELLGARK